MKTFRPVFFFAVFVLIVGLACNIASGGGGTPSQPQQQEPAQPQPLQTEEPNIVEPAPQPTEPPVPTPTEAPVEASKYFTEEFDQDPGWDYFLTFGDEDKVTVEFSDSRMKFEMEDLNIYAYYLYEQYDYGDVRLDIRAENRGKNNNNVSLICRASDDGWYEFSTEGGGLWYLYGVTINDNKEAVYNRIDNGGAQSLKQGKEVNDYAMICEGNEITLIINDKEIKTVKDNNYAFRDGAVGFNVSSLNVTPIIVEVDWFKISEP